MSVSGPIGTPPTRTTDRLGWCSRLTSLYGTEMRTTSLTPGMLRRLSAPNWSTSPTRPTMVRSMPRVMNASPPAPRTSSTIPSMSCWVASGAMTTTIAVSSCCCFVLDIKEAPGLRPGASGSRSRQRMVWRATVRVPGR